MWGRPDKCLPTCHFTLSLYCLLRNLRSLFIDQKLATQQTPLHPSRPSLDVISPERLPDLHRASRAPQCSHGLGAATLWDVLIYVPHQIVGSLKAGLGHLDSAWYPMSSDDYKGFCGSTGNLRTLCFDSFSAFHKFLVQLVKTRKISRKATRPGLALHLSPFSNPFFSLQLDANITI